jgi:hypothetical protein
VSAISMSHIRMPISARTGVTNDRSPRANHSCKP